MSSKERVNVWISPVNADMLDRLARQPGATKASIVDAALKDKFFPEKDAQLEEMVLHRLDGFASHQGEMEKDVKVCVETLGLFILYWLSMMDPLDAEDRMAAQAAGQRRFKHFITQVSERLATDDGLSMRIAKQLGVDVPHAETDEHGSKLMAAE